MKLIIGYIFFIFIPVWGISQDVYSWQVLDKKSNSIIKNAQCFLNKSLLKSDSNLFFSLSKSELKDSNSILLIKAEGYNSLHVDMKSLSELKSNYFLTPKSTLLKKIIINSSKSKRNDVGNLQLSVNEVEKLPTFLGENDLIKAIQLLPGVQSSGDGNGIYVRGGGIDQNLILYDEVSLYNISHLFGFFSVFNSNAISKVDIYKSGIPSNYGGRVSSVIAIQSQTGDFKKWKSEIGIGFLATNIAVEGPIKKDTSSILLAARRTYVDYFNKLISAKSNYQTDYYFYDVNFKYVHKIGKRNKILISGLSGKDDFVYDDKLNNSFKNNINWQTRLISAQWLSELSENLRLKVSIGFVDYSMLFGAAIYNYNLNLNSKINDISYKNEFSLSHLKKSKLTFGTEIIKHTISPNNFDVQGESTNLNLNKNLKLNSFEYNFFASEDFQLNEKWKIVAGLRYSIFQQLGPFQRLLFSENKVVYDSVFYPTNKTISLYHKPEPRIQISYDFSEKTSFKLSYSTNYQYIHLAPVSSISLPTDVWVPSSSIIKPQVGRQISFGYSSIFHNDDIQFSSELYYKKMNNLIEYKEGVMSLISLQTNYDDNFYFGSGDSYGIEFLVKKNIGKWNGWVSYTLSKSTRNFPDIENNRTFFAKNDRRNDLSTVLNYELNDKLNLSAVFVFKTGNAMTIPVSRYILQGNIINTYSPKNSYRLAPYHRLDLSLNYLIKKTEKIEQNLNFSIYNVLARQNPFYIYFETTGELSKFSIQTKAKQVSLFTILPSISWKVVFK